MEKKKVAWIGTGVMGSQQAGHLAKHGYTVSAYTHRYEKLLELQQQFGIIPCKTIAEAVQDADYIFVMVGYPSDVKEVFCDRGGIFDSAKPGALAIDMTTSSPSLAQQLYEQGKEKGIRVMDAPVSGGRQRRTQRHPFHHGRRRRGRLCRSDAAVRVHGQKHHPHGSCRRGQHTKAANQIAVAGATAAYTEALVYAQKAGLDPQKMLSAIGARSRRQLAADQHGSACAGRRFCTGLLHQALYQGYEDCAGGKPQERRRAGDAGHRFGSL